MKTKIENLPKEQSYTVYMHIFPNGKKYVGITGQTLKERWRTGGNGYKPQKLLWRAIQKYGWENVMHVVIAENLTVEEAGALEKKAISAYDTNNILYGYNQSIGGENSPIGVKRSKETREKLRISHLGQTGNKGHHLSEDQKRYLSEINTGKHLSEETKRKISEKNKGTKPSTFAIRRVKEVCNKPVVFLKTGEHYESATVASLKSGEHRNTITRHCRNEVREPRWAFEKKY